MNRLKLVLNYFKLKEYMINKLGYSRHSAKITIGDLRKMKPDIIKHFILWFEKGVDIPAVLYGINFYRLMEHRGLNHISALIAIDYYAKNPQEGYSMLALLPKDSDDNRSDLPEDIKAMADKILQGENTEDKEDTSDICFERIEE
ncbi:MAG: hypothetical protein IKU60_02550 [Clostridia bacterium]|nr:hypothetical protein [Clostridia bacterium]